MSRSKTVATHDKKKPKQPSQSSTLVALALRAGCELWHTADGDPYATIQVGTHQEHWPVRSRGFRRWLARVYYRRTAGSAPGAQAQQDALNVLEGQAIYDGRQHETAVRVAQHDGAIYLDLANDGWQAVRVTGKRWEVVDKCPVRFRRARAQLPLPTPVSGGDIAALRRFLNVNDGDWRLVVAWLLAAYRPSGPYPALCLHGEQGSGKSTQARALRRLIDPNTADLRCEPREPRDLMIAANNGWVVALDNISYLPPWLSDALCRLSTGGGFAIRTLYENDEETIFNATRPVLITGIEEVATRSDLLDRSILVTLPTIPADRRLPESDYWVAYEKARPAILGAMLTAVSEAMRRLPSIRLSRLPRMADFALWATAGEQAMGLARGSFMAAYDANRAVANESALESSPVAKAILDMMAATIWWSDTASELLSELERLADEKTVRLRTWPKTPRGLSGAVKRLAPNLRQAGIDVDFSREPDRHRRRLITLSRQSEESGNPSSTPSTPSDTRQNADAPTGGSDAKCPQEALNRTIADGSDAQSPFCSNDDREERAAIMEYEGGMSRAEAERLAGIAATDPEEGASWQE